MEQRLIDANALKKDFNLNFGGVSHAVAAAEIIDRQPTIDPESLRPTAHWETPLKNLDVLRCSNCATIFPGNFESYNYCPNCGAKMEG